MCRNTRGCPSALLPPSQATVRSSTWMISVGLAAGPSMALLRILYGGGGPYDSDATHAFNLRPRHRMRSRLLSALSAVLLLVSGCVEHLVPPGPAVTAPREAEGAFVMADGMHLPYRSWLPDGDPGDVVLALHGMNDSRDAWEYPAPDLAAHGVAVFGPDQRGFGGTADRGYWPGTRALVDDARVSVIIRAR